MRRAKIIGWSALGLVALAVLVPVLLGSIWIERREFLGLKYGMSADEVIDVLIRAGGRDILPRQYPEIAITKENADAIEQLRDAPGICVASNSEGRSLNVGFENDRVATTHESVRIFAELSGVETKDDLISRLPSMFDRHRGLVVAACVPDVRWVRVRETTDALDRKYLAQYGLWLFDEPDSYSAARLVFVEGRLSRVDYQWRMYEPL
jgi:hypothetical protein